MVEYCVVLCSASLADGRYGMRGKGVGTTTGVLEMEVDNGAYYTHPLTRSLVVPR
jgi:hypothetical protein